MRNCPFQGRTKKLYSKRKFVFSVKKPYFTDDVNSGKAKMKEISNKKQDNQIRITRLAFDRSVDRDGVLFENRRYILLLLLSFMICLFCGIGCGTTKWSDTSRTGTEQLLITSAMDDVIDEIDFYPLSGRKVYIKKDGITCSDSIYLFSVLRQQLAANGVFIKDKEDEAEYILEVAPGAVGTDRYDLIYGITSTNVPSVLTGGVSTSIPEVSFVKRTDQKAEVKLMLWAYNKKSGSIIWQSGRKTKTAFVRNRWILGMGPITKSSYNPKISVSGDEVNVQKKLGEYVAGNERPSVKTEAIYREVDQNSLERLEEIRKEGAYRYVQKTEKSTSKDESKDSDAKTESAPDQTAAASDGTLTK